MAGRVTGSSRTWMRRITRRCYGCGTSPTHRTTMGSQVCAQTLQESLQVTGHYYPLSDSTPFRNKTQDYFSWNFK